MPNERYRLANPCLHKLRIYFAVSKLTSFCIADENDSDLLYSEVPLKGKNKTLVKILGGRQHRTTPAGQILGLWLRRSTTVVYRTDRKDLSTARLCRASQLATADTWFRTCHTSSFCTVTWQLAIFQLTRRRIARFLGDSWASCRAIESRRFWPTPRAFGATAWGDPGGLSRRSLASEN